MHDRDPAREASTISDEKLLISDNGNFAVYNTRLYTNVADGLQPIFALFSKNKHPDRQPWYFMKWCNGWSDVDMGSHQTFGVDATEPLDIETTNRYTDNDQDEMPTWWVTFYPRIPMLVDERHILGKGENDNRKRVRAAATIPGGEAPSDSVLANMFTSAVIKAKIMAVLSPQDVVPQLFRPGGLGSGSTWRKQLLVPLHLRGEEFADCVLTLELCKNARPRAGVDPTLKENCSYYRASTVLTIDMARGNARLVRSVGTSWLRAEHRQINAQQRQIDVQQQQIIALQADVEKLAGDVQAAQQAHADEDHQGA